MNKMRLNLGNTKKEILAIGAGSLLLCLGMMNGPASGYALVPDDQKALITVQGIGANPFSQISLSTGPEQTITTKADAKGQFLFSNLQYASFTNLKFSLDIPSYEKGLAKNYPSNHLEFKYNVKESIARISGHIGKYGTLAFNLAGSETGALRFAGLEGYVASQTRTAEQMASGRSALTASIVNATEICCPRMILPSTPITLTILSQPVFTPAPVAIPEKKEKGTVFPILRRQEIPGTPQKGAPENKNSIPYIQNQETPHKQTPYILSPHKNKPGAGTQEDNKKEKPKIPYIVQGQLDTESVLILPDIVAAGPSFTSNDYNATYVGGVKNISDSDRNTMTMKIATLGAFLDVRTYLDTLRALQISTVRTLKNYTASDAVCRFGTMTRSIASADAVAKKNQMALSKILLDRYTQKEGTISADPIRTLPLILDNFKEKYCVTRDNNNFLDGYCEGLSLTSDLLHNRDIDFTRVFDLPLTLNADFSDSTITNDKQAVIALFDNLSMTPLMMSSEASAFDPHSNSDQAQNIRSLSAMKTVTANSFGALIGEKAQSTAQATNYMKEMIKQLGLDATSAEKLLGANPSYFAQMEVLTKKLFQNPAFYANLYESEANIDRQRVAMKAIELQQDRDFLESLRRREMLLSVLLNAKLQRPTSRADESGYVRKYK